MLAQVYTSNLNHLRRCLATDVLVNFPGYMCTCTCTCTQIKLEWQEKLVIELTIVTKVRSHPEEGQ